MTPGIIPLLKNVALEENSDCPYKVSWYLQPHPSIPTLRPFTLLSVQWIPYAHSCLWAFALAMPAALGALPDYGLSPSCDASVSPALFLRVTKFGKMWIYLCSLTGWNTSSQGPAPCPSCFPLACSRCSGNLCGINQQCRWGPQQPLTNLEALGSFFTCSEDRGKSPGTICSNPRISTTATTVTSSITHGTSSLLESDLADVLHKKKQAAATSWWSHCCGCQSHH